MVATGGIGFLGLAAMAYATGDNRDEARVTGGIMAAAGAAGYVAFFLAFQTGRKPVRRCRMAKREAKRNADLQTDPFGSLPPPPDHDDDGQD